LRVDLGLDFIFACLFRFIICVCFVSIQISPFVFLAFVVLGLFSSVPSQEISWEKRLLNDLFCVEWNVGP